MNARSDAVATFCPGADDVEQALRRRLHKAQGAAVARATRSQHWRARSLLWLASQWAADWTFRPASHEELDETLKGLARLFLCAGTIERLEDPDGD